MVGFLKKLFGGEEAADGAAKGARGDPVDYKGFTIEPAPYPEGGQHQLAGYISKTIEGEHREHHFVRADRFAAREEAERFAVVKAKQIIDEQGEAVLRE